MFKESKAFSSFAVKDIAKAKDFYQNVLGLAAKENAMGILELEISGSSNLIIYPKPDHQPAVFTVLNFPVSNIEKAVDDLIEKGITFEQYDQEHLKTDKKGISRSEQGTYIAWFKDPDGNILSILEDSTV